MNQFQQTLFNDLVALTIDSDTFFKQSFDLDGIQYWIFNYRLSSYTEFLKPNALNCRGTMFEVDQFGQAVRLAALPLMKFFNLNENPSTMGLDISTVDWIQDKRDGSLISTYLHNDELRLKSKGSLGSEQAVDAMKWLHENEADASKATLINGLKLLAVLGHTVDLEWTAPHNRIVVGYGEPKLTILSIRNNKTGEYLDIRTIDYIDKVWFVNYVETDDPKAFVESIPAMTESIEGFVVRLKDGTMFKCKTDAYCALHHTKDSINNPRRLFECVVNEASDDLLSLFASDELAVKLIHEMQVKVAKIYNSLVSSVETFYETNKHLDRKDFAIKGRAEIDPQMYFGLVMNLYVGKTNNYKEFCIKHYKEFGFKDEAVVEVE
jgi:RNA ligase